MWEGLITLEGVCWMATDSIVFTERWNTLGDLDGEWSGLDFDTWTSLGEVPTTFYAGDFDPIITNEPLYTGEITQE